MRNLWLYIVLIIIGLVGLALSIATLFGLIGFTIYVVIILLFFIIIIAIGVILLSVALSCHRR